MPEVKVAKNKIYVGKKGIPLVSGEVHYWRLNPLAWKDILLRVREMGVEVISTYVPWDYHEYKRGSFDFTGKTDKTRNLKKFLDLTKSMGFWVVIRPGPYIYSEWPQDGVPKYAHKYHRLHPTFLKYAENYMCKVCRIIKPYLASKSGGHIMLFQADNELDPWPDLFGHQYGLSKKPGMFQDFIESLYDGDVNKLNASWGTCYESFKEASPFIATMLSGEGGLPLKGDKELRRHLDYFKFKYDYTRKIAKWNVEKYREIGIDVPIYLNTYPFFYAHDWSDLQEESDLVGIDLYPTNELSEDHLEYRKYADKIRFLAHTSKLPFIAEFQSGIWHGRHYETDVLTPNHYRLITLTSLLAGNKGWNWYMLVNRDNWYMSPINEWGRVRGELFEAFKNTVDIFKAIDPTTLEKVNEVGATMNPLQYAARTLPADISVLMGLDSADVDYELFDPRKKIPKKKVLFYSGNQWLEEGSQEHLFDYVVGGGTLVAFRDYPRKNEEFEPCSIVGFEDPERSLFEFKKPFSIQLAKGRKKINMVSSVYNFAARDAKKIEVDIDTYGKVTIGYIKKVGLGKIIHIGLEPNEELVREILDYLDVNFTAYSTTSDIRTALFKRGKKHFLVVINNGNEHKSALIYLPAVRGRKKAKDVLTREVLHYPTRKGEPFSLEIPRKDGRVIELS